MKRFTLRGTSACGTVPGISQPLSLTGKIWDTDSAFPVQEAASFAHTIRLQRGLTDAHAAVDPTVYPDLGKAVARLRRAFAEQESIAVFGDYDCDGVTSTALLQRLLQRHGAQPVIRLPHRMRDGYGIRVHHIDRFADEGVTLLLTVDNGIAAHEAMRRATERGIDVLILDHHHCDSPPDVHAILHPALAPAHPDPHPSAAGVAFSFMRAVEGSDHWQDAPIDRVLAMIGTIADLVPLTGSNRSLVEQGLTAIHELPAGPLQSFIARICGTSTISATDVAWKIAPRINAAGRMADPDIALRALLEEGDEADMLETLNAQRQSDTADALDAALDSLGPEGNLPPFLCTASASYSPGIVGLIAGKLTERFGRPSLAACIDGDTCTASLRSPPGYNVADALRKTADLLTHFGGHAQAAGASFPLDHFIELSDRLSDDARHHFGERPQQSRLQIDGTAELDVIDLHLYRHISTIAPFGQGNPEPLLLVHNVTLDRLRTVGANNQHLQARAGQLALIGFNLGHLTEQIAGTPVDLACRIGANVWNGKTEVQLIVADIRSSQMADSRLQHEKTSLLTSDI